MSVCSECRDQAFLGNVWRDIERAGLRQVVGAEAGLPQGSRQALGRVHPVVRKTSVGSSKLGGRAEPVGPLDVRRNDRGGMADRAENVRAGGQENPAPTSAWRRRSVGGRVTAICSGAAIFGVVIS